MVEMPVQRGSAASRGCCVCHGQISTPGSTRRWCCLWSPKSSSSLKRADVGERTRSVMVRWMMSCTVWGLGTVPSTVLCWASWKNHPQLVRRTRPTLSTGFEWQPAGAFVFVQDRACVRWCCERCEWEGWCWCRRCRCRCQRCWCQCQWCVVTAATAAVGGGISVDGAGVNNAGVSAVVAVAGDDGVGGVEGTGGGDNTGGIVVVAAAVSPMLQHEPSLHHRKAKPRMESIHRHERARECWMDRKESDRARGTQELGTVGRGTCN